MRARYDRAFVASASRAMKAQSADEVLRWALSEFPARQLTFSCSFGAEDVVLLDLFAKIGRFPRIFTLDTGRLPQETYNLMDEVIKKYQAPLEIYFPNSREVEEMVAEHGLNGFYQSVERRMLCCGVRKVHPLRRALKGCRAWITGLRREQSGARSAVTELEWDEEHGLVKLNPLAAWSVDQLWRHIRDHGVPYNKLHDKGYPSIGCAPCTRAVQEGDNPRAGRWWWEKEAALKECGLHPGKKA